PTGAAIVAALAAGPGRPAMLLERIGSGAGGKDFPDCPNILRAFLGAPEAGQTAGDQVVVGETNIDDSTPEVLGYVMERLLEAGALDVFFTPIQMKKNRPAVQLSFLCPPERLAPLAQLVLAETSAIGLRHYPAARITLERRVEERQTPFGAVRFKLVFDNGRLLRAAPEYEDCRRIAREQDIPLQEVLRAVTTGS
ncbi:MAG TPA: LarC family nickel insertion protein, partial [Desulfuromonadaceae bacterium]